VPPTLGEIQIDGDDAEIKVTTELQAFGLIVTAEPYFAVTQPSDVVVMENVVRAGTEGSVEVIQAKYELLRRGSYLMNQDAAKLKLKPLEPGAPLDLAQARNAVELARLAGADRFAEETFNKAAGLLATAETAREKKQRGNAVMMPARQAAQTAEDARLIGLQRQEDSYVAEERARALGREQQALESRKSRGRAKPAGRPDAQAARTARDLAERQAQIDAAARAAAELNARTATAGQATAERAAADADAARSAAEAARAQAVTAQQAAEAQARQAQGAAAQSEQDKTVLRDQLRTQLNVILETRETARGLIVNLSDVLFDTASSTLKRERGRSWRACRASWSRTRAATRGRGHTDSVGRMPTTRAV
jgi:hypothetical protein